MKLQYRIFGDADDVREVPLGRLETYDMGEMRIGRSILQPGRPRSNTTQRIRSAVDRENRLETPPLPTTSGEPRAAAASSSYKSPKHSPEFLIVVDDERSTVALVAARVH